MCSWCALRLDAQGHPHVAYGEDWLYYAFFDGLERHYEVADSSLRVGQYAYRDPSGWHAQVVDAEGDVGLSTSVALGSTGFPTISYDDRSGGAVKYARRDATGWHLETVDDEGYVGKCTSLALDTSGRPYISYYDTTNRDLKYARLVGVPTSEEPSVLLRIEPLRIWPNPTRGIVHARVALREGREPIQLSIFDLLGRRVMDLPHAETTGSGEATITLRLPESMPSGHYVIAVQTENTKGMGRITIVR